jgi:hypothetical protein
MTMIQNWDLRFVKFAKLACYPYITLIQDFSIKECAEP